MVGSLCSSPSSPARRLCVCVGGGMCVMVCYKCDVVYMGIGVDAAVRQAQQGGCEGVCASMCVSKCDVVVGESHWGMGWSSCL